MAETLLTTEEGDTTTTTTEEGTATTENSTTDAGDAGAVETFDADGKPTEGGEFDKDGNKIEVSDDKDKGGEDDKDKGKSEGAPESYETFTLLEGIEINEADLTEFSDIAKDLNLTQDQAQKLVDYQSKRAEAADSEIETQLQEAFQKQQEDWVAELKADKDFGGDNLDKNIGLGVKVVNKFGSPELKTVLDSSGMGNNPELIKMFSKIGKAFSEDSLDHDADTGSGAGKSIEEKLYPNQGK